MSRAPTSRRRLLRLVGAAGVAGAASLAGCAGGSGDAGGGGGELVATLGADVKNYDPTRASDTTSSKAFDLVYEPLVSVDFDGTVRSRLATSLERRDESTWRVSLREGVTFHDGSALTASDVKATFERYEGTPRESDVSIWYDDATVRDDHTLDITLSGPYAPLESSLAGVPIVPEAAATADLDLSTAPVGTGPYTFDEHQPDRFFRIVANDDHWYDGEPSTPPVDAVTFRIIVEQSAQQAALEAGDVDLINDPPTDAVSDLRSRDEVTVTEHEAGGFEMLLFPLASEPFTNRKVRRGITRLVPREEIISTVYAGVGRPAYAPVPPLLSAYSSESFQQEMRSTYAGYDPERASRLLAEGFDELGLDRPYELSILTNENPERVRWTQLVRDRLNGTPFFSASVQQFEWNTYVERALAGDSHRTDALLALGWTGGWDPDDYLRNLFHSEQATPACCNATHYANPTVDRLLDEAVATYDTDERRTLYQEAQRRIVADAPAVFVRFSTRFDAASDAVSGFRTYPLDTREFAAIYAPWAGVHTTKG
jgi:peptide/nickel transport system substrate-binding protein